MNIKIHPVNDLHIAEITSDDLVIRQAEDGLDIIGNTRYQGADAVILYEENITPEFFDLKSGLAGEILQKFSTYQVRIVIVGNYAKYPSKSLRDFIVESNRGKQVNFLASVNEALSKLSN